MKGGAGTGRAWAAVVLLMFGVNLVLAASLTNTFFSVRDVPDVESPPAPYVASTTRLVIIQIDGLRRDHAFDPGIMPNLTRLRDEGAGGQSLTPEVVMTSICVKTMWTGTSPDIMSIITNWDPPPAEVDNFFRQADAAGMRIAMIGDESLGNQFGKWADLTHDEADGGITNINASDQRVFSYSHLITNLSYDVVDLHFAGIDHAGHAYTLDSPQYRAKCREMDDFIGSVAEAIDDNTTLMISVDHAQTDQGLHGYGDYQARDGVVVYWGKGVAKGVKVDMDQRDVAATTCALMGLPVPVASEGVPRVEVIDTTDEERATIMRYAANVRAMYLERYAADADIPLPSYDTVLSEIDTAYLDGDWNRTVALSASAILEMNGDFEDSQAVDTLPLLPMLAGFLAAVAGAVLLMGGGPPSRAVFAPPAVLSVLGVVEFFAGVLSKSLVQHEAWRWSMAGAVLALCAATLYMARRSAGCSLARRKSAVAGGVIIAVASLFTLASFTVILHSVYMWDFPAKVALGAGVVLLLSAVVGAGLAFRGCLSSRFPGWGWLIPFAAACVLAGLFVRFLAGLSVFVLMAFVGYGLYRALKGDSRRAVLVSSVSAAAVLFLAFITIPEIAYEHVSHWTHTNPKSWPLLLGLLSSLAVLAATFALSLSNGKEQRPSGGVAWWAVVAAGFILAAAFHYLPDTDFLLLDWTARVVLLLGLAAFVRGVLFRRAGLVFAASVVLYTLMGTPGQMVVFSLFCVIMWSVRGLDIPGKGAFPRFWRSALVLSGIYVSFYALDYTFAFTAFDIRASTIGMTELVLPWATAVIILKYSLPILISFMPFYGGALLDTVPWVAVFLAGRTALIGLVLLTDVKDFHLLIAFTGELLFNLVFLMGVVGISALLLLGGIRNGSDATPADG